MQFPAGLCQDGCRVLVVDDERNIRRTLRMILEGEGCTVDEAANAEDGLALLEKDRFQAVLMDVKLPGMDGIAALQRIMTIPAPPPVIMISGHASIKDAVDAVRMGAHEFLEKPLDRERVMSALRHCLEMTSHARKAIDASGVEMIGESPLMRKLLDDISKVAPTNGRVLITGESGTGKELVARCLHALSTRAENPFVMLNCAAIPSELIESELFGYEKGAFTGAAQRKKGMVELANNGTLFLDEVGDMGHAAQAKVLRVLQTGEFSRLGSEEVNTADVRIISATNKDIAAEISAGRFRDDLYYRLNVVPIHVPPLRDRAEDVPMLVSRFIADSCNQAGLRPKTITPEALETLRLYQWPGNIRELKNLIERLVIMTGPQKMLIELQDIPENVMKNVQKPAGVQHISEPPKTDGGRSLKEIKGGVERDAILKVLEESDWNVSKAAATLGIERTNLHKKMKAHGIQRP